MLEAGSPAKLAGSIADASRATRLTTTLLSGRAYSATELADAAAIGRLAASARLARLVDAGSLGVVRKGATVSSDFAMRVARRRSNDCLG